MDGSDEAGDIVMNGNDFEMLPDCMCLYEFGSNDIGLIVVLNTEELV